jgi:hypothetical protein
MGARSVNAEVSGIEIAAVYFVGKIKVGDGL